MSDTRGSFNDGVMERIAAALERLAPEPARPVNWLSHPAYLWSQAQVHSLEEIDALALDRLHGIDAQAQAVHTNLQRLSKGAAAHDMLLWGARGMGKSALIRAATHDLQKSGANIALVEVNAHSFAHVPLLIETLSRTPRAFLLFIDDLGFDEGDLQGNLGLRSLLDGSALGRASNIKVAVTSNRRAVVQAQATRPSELHERDERDNALALADRFGLSLAFHPCDQVTYLAIVRSYTEPLGLAFAEEEANAWAIAGGARSGRTAFQFACEVAGRAGLAL